ncbi:hypothetical protein O1W71_01885 [Microbacterium sp. H37-C3]|uniref:hypothetical protein n=1 Tax=Microbacterium sp. H37-C3 TaxID=3004354 RepID=UPI0022AF72D7|nr:hypothetical protein [Microbacterium sp. H37-C3]MCZ4066418.1 hypothetical protein [Microbacterium sp. H37-C3]
MAEAESIEIKLARLDERTQSTADDVSEIKRNMATRADQGRVDERIRDLTGALERERAERVAAVQAEKAERIAADEKEADERKVVAARLQTVEDRMEARKYNTAIAILISVLGSVLGVLSLVYKPLLGG